MPDITVQVSQSDYGIMEYVAQGLHLSIEEFASRQIAGLVMHDRGLWDEMVYSMQKADEYIARRRDG